MIGELGHLALILGFLVAVDRRPWCRCSGAWRRVPAWMARRGVSAARAQFLLLGISYLCLTQVFIVSDFSFSYVAQNSNTALPLVYKISAVWGAHEGSMLLWATVLAGWGFAVATFSTSLPELFRARVLGGDGAGQRRVPSLPPAHLESVRAAASRAAGGARSQSAPAGPRHGRTPAAALHGVRRPRGAVQLRGRRP